MSYEDAFSDVVKVIEAVGGGIMVVGGLVALARYARQMIADDPEAIGRCGKTSDV